MALRKDGSFEFGPFRLEVGERLLLRDGSPVPLPPKAFALLAVLVERSGRLVTKDELLREVWPATFVEEANLSYTVSVLRKAMADEAEPHRYIETVPKGGYRFREPVRALADAQVEQPGGRRMRRMGFAVATASIGVIVAVAWIASWSTIRTPPAKAAADSTLVRAIAVLPFVNQSRQASHEPFVDGVHEALITELSKVGALRVIARTSSMRYRNTDKTLTEIAGELNVDSIIEGDVLRDAERVRVSIRLADPRSQTNRWSEQYDRDLKDVIALQSEIARAIARRIRVAVSDSEQTRLAVERPANVAAYEAYVRGRHHARKLTKRDMEDAIAWFERAIELDRDYAEAYSGLADACLRHELFESRTPAADAIRNKMRIAVRSALRLDDTIADAHWLLGVVHGIDHDWPAAEREFLRAIELDPSNSEARRRYAYYLTSVGRADAGAAQITRAIELDPLHAGLNSAAYWPFFCARQYDRALEQLMKAQAIDPHFPMQWVLLGRVYTAMKMYDDAIASFEKAAAANISIDITSSARAFVGHAYAASGRKQRALTIAREFERNRQQGDAAAAAVAMIYAELRDAASAVKWLERASAARNSMVRSLKADPAWDPIRSDPRFQDLILRMRLPS